MKISKFAAIVLCLIVAACKQPAPEAAAPAADNAAVAADAASQTQASYGDDAPVAIEAAPPEADEDHAHAADGSHPPEAKAEEAHEHEPGDADHDH